MCRAVTCRTCGKTTWAGCGQHVDSVLRGVPRSRRCEGHVKEKVASGPGGEGNGGFLTRLFGR